MENHSQGPANEDYEKWILLSETLLELITNHGLKSRTFNVKTWAKIIKIAADMVCRMNLLIFESELGKICVQF